MYQIKLLNKHPGIINLLRINRITVKLDFVMIQFNSLYTLLSFIKTSDKLFYLLCPNLSNDLIS